MITLQAGAVQHAKIHSVFDSKNHRGGHRLERTIGATGNDYIELGSFQQTQGSFILLVSTAIIEATAQSSTDFYIITGDYNQTANAWNLLFPTNHTDQVLQVIAKINNDVLSLRLLKIASTPGTQDTITQILDMSTGDTVFTPASGAGSMTGSVPATPFPTTLLSQYLNKIWARGALDMGGNSVGNAADPVGNQDLTTKIWVLAEILSAMQDWIGKDNVDAATTGALPSNTRTDDVLTAIANGAFPTIDGIPAALDKDYLVKNEGGVASHVDNGIYTLTQLGDLSNPWKLTRRADLIGGDNAAGAYLAVEAGTLNGDKTFRCTNDKGNDVVNTNALVFLYWGNTIDHANLLNVLPNQHHNKSHAHDGVDGSGTVAHADTTGQAVDDHHAQDHKTRHQNGGADEINVNALSGELADGQPAKIIQDSEEGVDSTNSTTPQLAFQSVQTLETAKYIVIMQAEFQGQGLGGNRVVGSFEVDAGAGNVVVGSVNITQNSYCIRTTFFFLDATAGSHDFDFYFNRGGAGISSVNIRRKRLSIFKVVE